jgi:hypothetical protein
MIPPATSKTDRLQVSVHIQAEVISTEAARRQANFWLLENIGNLLRAESLELVLGDRLVWRADIVLTSPQRGRLGVVGRLEIDATTGEILANVPPHQLFPSCGHQEIQGRLAYALQERLPALITGEVGAGKSTAVRAFVQTLDRTLPPLVYLANPRLNVAALYAHILLALQFEPAHTFNRLLPQLQETLQTLARKNRFPLLIVDEVHLRPSMAPVLEA